jgi:hypothetical protein
MQFPQLWIDNNLAIRRERIVAIVFLMVIFGFVKRFQRNYFSHDPLARRIGIV